MTRSDEMPVAVTAGGAARGPARRRAMTLLTTAQMLYYFGISIDLTLTGLAGYRLTPVPALATLPFALISVVSWATTYPASRFMSRYGRRAGFLAGSSCAVVGGAVSVTALYAHQFVVFCVGVGCIGIYQAFAGYYRYAAADIHPPELRGRAISTVLSGGVLAAVAGPFLATRVKDVLPVEFAGSYALVTVLAVLSVCVVSRLRIDTPVAMPAGADAAVPDTLLPRRALREIARQPVFVTGLIGSCAGYLVMTMLMTAAPIAAVRVGHSVDQGAQVIQWHMVGMYATALLSGVLTRRIGPGWTLLIGAASSALGAGTAASGTSEMRFMAGLGLIGVGWNLMYVAGTALVANSYHPHERSVVQGVGEIFTLGGSAVGALAAGPLLAVVAWRPLSAGMLVPLAVSAFATVAFLAASRARAAGAGSPGAA